VDNLSCGNHGPLPPLGRMPGNSGVCSVMTFHEAPVSRSARKSTGV
jgi:hypothetical protein